VTTRFEEWEAERLQDPKFLAALEKQYPKSERDEAQVRITILQEENASMRAEAGRRFDADNERMVRYETGRRMLKEALRRTQQERDTMREALEAAPQTRDVIGSGGQLRYCEWYHLRRQAALGKDGD